MRLFSSTSIPRREALAQPLLPDSAPRPRSLRHPPGAPQPRDGFAVRACGFLEQKGSVCGGTSRKSVPSGHRAPRVSPRCPPAGGGPGRGVGEGSPRPLITPGPAAGSRRRQTASHAGPRAPPPTPQRAVSAPGTERKIPGWDGGNRVRGGRRGL